MWKSGGEMSDPDKEVLAVCLFYLTEYRIFVLSYISCRQGKLYLINIASFLSGAYFLLEYKSTSILSQMPFLLATLLTIYSE